MEVYSPFSIDKMLLFFLSLSLFLCAILFQIFSYLILDIQHLWKSDCIGSHY